MIPKPKREPSDESNDRTMQAAAPYGAWLSKYSWDHFLTVGFPDFLRPEAVQARFRKGIRALESYWGHLLAWAATVEYGASGGRPHVHALISGSAVHPVRELVYPWKFLHTHARDYDPTRGAAYYATKQCNDEESHLFMAHRLPRLLTTVYPSDQDPPSTANCTCAGARSTTDVPWRWRSPGGVEELTPQKTILIPNRPGIRVVHDRRCPCR